MTTGKLADRRSAQPPIEAAGGGQRTLGWLLQEVGHKSSTAFRLTHRDRQRHLYILGATGSGKTNMILGLISADLSQGRSIAVIDLRGDLIDRILHTLAKAGTAPSEVTLLDLREREQIIGFNPLTGPSEPHSRAYMVLDALRSSSESWGIQLEETLRNCLVALAEANLSLLELEPLLTNSQFRAAILARSTDPSVNAFFERFASLSAERQQAWVLPVLNKLTPFINIPRLRLLFGCPNAIDFDQVLDSPGSILLVSLGVDRFHSASRLVGSLIVGVIEACVMARVDIAEGKRNTVNLYVDEFESMATEAFARIVAEGRRFKLALTLSHQNFTQIPSNLRQVIRNNVQTQVFFQTGSIDARELRKDLVSEDGEDLSKDLLSLPVGHAFVSLRPQAPTLVKFELAEESHGSETNRDFCKQVHDSMGAMTPDETESAIQSRSNALLAALSQEKKSSKGMSVRHTKKPGASKR